MEVTLHRLVPVSITTDIVVGDIIETPMGQAVFAGEVKGREDGRNVLVELCCDGGYRLFKEEHCTWVGPECENCCC